MLKNQLKGIKLLQDGSKRIEEAHAEIKNSIDDIKSGLLKISQQQMGYDVTQSDEYRILKEQILQTSRRSVTLRDVSIEEIYAEANAKYPQEVKIDDILTTECKQKVSFLVDNHIKEFNLKYGLDGWDYAIAGSCGLFASMLDILCVSAPPVSSKTPYHTKVDGIFNQWVQEAFNKFLTPEISEQLSKANKIGSADISVMGNILNAPPKILNPTNHRLKELSHDPVLGLFFGLYDMMTGKVTIAGNGTITSYDTKVLPIEGSIIDNIKTMFWHLLSDVNAP